MKGTKKIHGQTVLYIDSEEEKKENRSQMQENWAFSVCSYLAKICGYMIDVWFFHLFGISHGKLPLVSFQTWRLRKILHWHAVTCWHMQFISKMIKVYRVVCIRVCLLFSSGALSVSSPVPTLLGITADYFKVHRSASFPVIHLYLKTIWTFETSCTNSFVSKWCIGSYFLTKL